jgi:hypothetical protein
MTITYSIEHVGTSVEDVSIEVAPKSDLCHMSHVNDPKTGENSTKYVLVTGNPAYPSTVTFRSAIAGPVGRATRRISMTFQTWLLQADSVAGTEKRSEISATLSFIVPTDIPVELADLDDMLGTVFSFLYEDVTSKVRDTTWLGKLLYGVTEVAG